MKLNPEQQAAVIHKDGPCLILAGAGSGKTRVIVNRIARLIIKEKIPPWQILAVTFTNKAAKEMRERIEAFEEIESPCGVNMGTFHSVCVRLLRREHEKLGYHQSFSICDDTEQISRLKAAIEKAGFDIDRFKPKTIQSAISKAKNEFLSPAKYAQAAGFNPAKKVAAEVYKIYQQNLKSDHSLDFDDLIVETVKLLQSEPELLKKYQNRYRYILIDEYQDTNVPQNKLIGLLGDRYRNVMAVGDDDQSIYRWRGAEVSNILDFSKNYPGAKIIKLQQNYRSAQVILSAAASLMEHNKNRHAKKLWSSRTEGETPEYREYFTDRNEAEGIASVIQSQVNKGERKYSDFAVFYRMNAQSRVLEETFQNCRIPNQIIGNISFFKRKEVKDLLAYIRLALNPYDSGACRRIINVPRRGIGQATLEILTKLAESRDVDLFSAIEIALTEKILKAHKFNSVNAFFQMTQELIRFERTHNAAEFVTKCLAATGYKEMYLIDSSQEARNSMEIIHEFENTVAEFSQREQCQLSDFADYLSLHSEDEDEEDNVDRVQLMTFHNAKGLEFPVVFLTGMEESVCPLIRMGDTLSEEDLEEERRLVYVGMTRAEDKLYMSGASTRYLYGKAKHQQRSRFIDEINPEFLQISGEEIQSKQTIKAVSSVNLDAPVKEYHNGNRVRHPKWGLGIVLNCSGTGPKAKLVIRFDRFGRKKIQAGLANLSKIS